MGGDTTDFDWSVDESTEWPPQGRPKAPFGPVILEIMRSCPLRGCFEASTGYERRMDMAGRIGTAFHRTVETLNDHPPLATGMEAFVQEARRQFAAEVAAQEMARAQRPRERWLPKDQSRLDRALDAVILEARRLFAEKIVPRLAIPTPAVPSTEHGVYIHPLSEVPVSSRDGQFRGRVDRVELLVQGVRLLDYKSALRDDLPDRYIRQLQLYSLLWYETFGTWPAEALVIYPLTGSAHPVPVDPELCRQVATEYRRLVARLKHEQDPDRLATPGDVCRICEFRPWCRPFWQWQATESSHTAALERAALGFEAVVTRLSEVDGHWLVLAQWRGCTLRLVAPVERLPQLARAQTGTRIRVLDARLRGNRLQPQAVLSEYSEVFLALDKR